MDTHLEGINKIYEINEKEFIFGTDEYIDASMGGPEHNYLLLEKIELKKIKTNEINEKLNTIKEKDNFFLILFLMKKIKMKKIKMKKIKMKNLMKMN